MNNRIREILTAATVWCEDNAQGTPVAWEWEERVATLVIEECIKVIQSGITRDGHDTPQYRRTMTHIADIKKHFGVE